MLVKPNSKSLLAYFPIVSHPYLMPFHFLPAKVKHSCFVLDRENHVSQKNCSTTAQPTRCGESFVGDNRDPQLLICTFHFYMVQIRCSAKKLGDRINHGSTPPYTTTLVCTFQYLKDAIF
jgi:hypothetical protein